MNDLSIFIYLAEVCGRIQNGAGFIGFMLAFVGGVGICFLWAFHLIETVGSRSLMVTVTALWFVLSAFMMTLSALTPSSRTLYMIAASEAGETVVTSPEAQEIFNDLKNVIKKKLKDELGEEK